MSLIAWIVVLVLSAFWYAPVTIEPSTEITEATPAVLLRADAGPLSLDSEFAARLGRGQPGVSVAYAATDSALFRTDANGEWIEVGDTPPSGHIVVADDTGVLMTGDQERCYQGGGGASLNVSTDGGETWRPSDDERAIRPLAIWADDGLAIGVWCGEILLSNDLGATWHSPPDDATLGFDVTAFAVLAGAEREILFALTGEGGTSSVYHVALDDPDAWSGLEPIFTYWALGGLAGTDDTFTIASITGVSTSTDAGLTWTTDRRGLEDYTLEIDPAVEGLPEGVDPTGLGFRSILIDDGGNPIALGGESDVLSRHEDGKWQHAVGHGEPTEHLALAPDGSSIFAQAESAVWVIDLDG